MKKFLMFLVSGLIVAIIAITVLPSILESGGSKILPEEGEALYSSAEDAANQQNAVGVVQPQDVGKIIPRERIGDVVWRGQFKGREAEPEYYWYVAPQTAKTPSSDRGTLDLTPQFLAGVEWGKVGANTLLWVLVTLAFVGGWFSGLFPLRFQGQKKFSVNLDGTVTLDQPIERLSAIVYWTRDNDPNVASYYEGEGYVKNQWEEAIKGWATTESGVVSFDDFGALLKTISSNPRLLGLEEIRTGARFDKIVFSGFEWSAAQIEAKSRSYEAKKEGTAIRTVAEESGLAPVQAAEHLSRQKLGEAASTLASGLAGLVSNMLGSRGE